MDDEVLGKFSQAVSGTSTDGPPTVEEETLEEFLPFGIIRDRLQASFNDGELKKPLLADPGKDFEDRFCGLNGGELFDPILGIHLAAPRRALKGSSPFVQQVKARSDTP